MTHVASVRVVTVGAAQSEGERACDLALANFGIVRLDVQSWHGVGVNDVRGAPM